MRTAVLAALVFAACNSRGGLPEPVNAGPDLAATEDLAAADLASPPGPDLARAPDLAGTCDGGPCPLVQPLGAELTLCAGRTYHVPTLAAGGGAFALGCLPDGSQRETPTLKILDGAGAERSATSLLTMDGNYYKDIQVSYHDGRFQSVYEYNCDDGGGWGVGWGWGCIDFREHSVTGAQVTGSTVFGQRGHNGHPVLDYSGASFGVAWVSYDTAYFRRINGDRTLAGADRFANIRIAQDPQKSDDRSAARTKIAWDGSAFGVFVIVGDRLYFSRLDAAGQILVPFTPLGSAFSQTFSGQFSVVWLGGLYHVAYLDPVASKVVVLRVGVDGMAQGSTPVLAGMYRFPHLISVGGSLYLFSSSDAKEGQLTVLDAAGAILKSAPLLPGRVVDRPVAAYDAAADAGAVAYLDASAAVRLQRIRLGRP